MTLALFYIVSSLFLLLFSLPWSFLFCGGLRDGDSLVDGSKTRLMIIRCWSMVDFFEIAP